MAKTSDDVINRAHRVLGLLAVDEVPTADMNAYALDTLEAAFDQLRYQQGVNANFDLTSIPDAVFIPLADLVASEISGHYSVNGPVRSRAISQLRAYLNPDDR